jgi:hypothetical protein
LKRRALLVTLVSYVACIVVLATAPELPGTVAGYAYVPALITIILLSSYWFFIGLRPGALGRFFAVLAILILISVTASSIEGSPTGTRSQAASASNFTPTTVLNYAGNCLLTPVPKTYQSSSGYAVVSFGGSDALSQGDCNGVGYVDASARASGVYGRADANGVLAFVDPGIFPAPNPNAQSYSLDVRVDFVLNGWQVSHSAGFPVSSSSVTLSVDFVIIDEKGNVVFDIFGDSWSGSQNLATGDYQLSYSLGLMPGHTYSAALKFTETASATVYALGGDASALGCFHFTGSCPADPFQDVTTFCPGTRVTSTGPCQDFEWRSMAFSLSAV